MRRIWRLGLALAAIASGWHAATAAPVLLPDPVIDLRTPASPKVGAVAADGKTYVGGSFGDVNSTLKPMLARLNPDGSVDTSWTMATQGSFYPQVYAVALGNGRVYAATSRPFSYPTMYDVLSLSPANGSADGAFAVQHSASLQALAIDASGNILFGGALGTTTVQGVTHDGNIARVNAAGQLDTGWYPPLDGTVEAIAVINGSVFVAGNCLAFDIDSSCRNVVKLSANGAVDPTWTANVACATSLAPSLDNTALYVGCANGGYSTPAVYKLALATGAELWRWAPSSFADVRALLPLSDGNLYVAGNLRCGASYCALQRLAQGDGTLDAGWQLSGGYGLWLIRRGAVQLGLIDNSDFVEVPYNTATPGRTQLAHFTYRVGAEDVACDPRGGRAMLFTSWPWLEAPVSSRYAALLQPSGQPDYSWHFNGGLVNGYPSSWRAGAFDTDGSLVAAMGDAVRFGGYGSTEYKLVRFSGAGLAPDTTWVPQLNGSVSGVAIDAAHRVYVSGSGLAGPDDALVRLDTASGAVQAWSVNSGLTYGYVRKMVPDEKHGRLFVIEGGYDQYAIRRDNRLRVYSTAGGPWLWQFPDDSYPDDQVTDVAIDGSGYAYVVGGKYLGNGYVGFTAAGGKPLVKLTPSGNRVATWAPTASVSSSVDNRLAVVGDRWLYVTNLNTSLISLRRVTTREPATLDAFSPNFNLAAGLLPVVRLCAGSQNRLFLTGLSSIDGNYRPGSIAIFGDSDPLLNDNIFYNGFE